ncbi:MAG: hypothetical protein ACI9MC_001646 [Kiritimatiellia bacterium]|jgi:hypothetical protein
MASLCLTACEINHPATNLVTGHLQLCLDAERAPLPQDKPSPDLWTFGARVVAVHNAVDTSDSVCSKTSTVVLELQTATGEPFNVGWRVVVEDVDVTPTVNIHPNTPIILRFGEIQTDEGHSHSMVLLHADGDLLLAAEDGAGMSVDELPGVRPIHVSIGDAQNGFGFTRCGTASNVALRFHADRTRQVKAGRRAELTLGERPITAVNVGGMAWREGDCEDHMPWFVVQGHSTGPTDWRTSR